MTENRRPLLHDNLALVDEVARLSSEMAELKAILRRIEGAICRGGDPNGFLGSYTLHFAKQLDGLHHWLAHVVREQTAETLANSIERQAAEDQRRDILRILLAKTVPQPLQWSFFSQRPIAVDSADHQHPRGTSRDNTRHPRFVARCEHIWTAPIYHLDLGCAGGGLVWDFTLAGHVSVGVEGSDFSLREQRAEWAIIPDRLFTGDVTQPYSFHDAKGIRQLFDLVTAWELLEHIAEHEIPTTLSNVVSNIKVGGVFVCSIATHPDSDPNTGVAWHLTLRPKDWWIEQFRTAGLEVVTGLFETDDFVRGSGNTRAQDWDVRAEPDKGFHLVGRRIPNHSS